MGSSGTDGDWINGEQGPAEILGEASPQLLPHRGKEDAIFQVTKAPLHKPAPTPLPGANKGDVPQAHLSCSPGYPAAKSHNEDLSPLQPAAPRITMPGAGGLSSSSCQFTLCSAQGPPPTSANTIPGDVKQPGPATATELHPARCSLWV